MDSDTGVWAKGWMGCSRVFLQVRLQVVSDLDLNLPDLIFFAQIVSIFLMCFFLLLKLMHKSSVTNSTLQDLESFQVSYAKRRFSISVWCSAQHLLMRKLVMCTRCRVELRLSCVPSVGVYVTTLNFHISRVATNVSCSSLMQNKNLSMLIFTSGKI